MFKLNTNNTFIINKGDTAYIPLFVNIGTRFEPIRCTFSENDGCEIYFYILPINAGYKQFLLKKTFDTSGLITTEIVNELPTTEQVETNLNNNHDFVVKITSDDLSNIFPGEYRYVIRAKVLKEKLKGSNYLANISTETKDDEFITVQITNKEPMFIIDDDINRAW